MHFHGITAGDTSTQAANIVAGRVAAILRTAETGTFVRFAGAASSRDRTAGPKGVAAGSRSYKDAIEVMTLSVQIVYAEARAGESLL